MPTKFDMIKDINKGFAKKATALDEPTVFLASGRPDLLDFGVIPTGNLAIDNAIGGGFPRGVPAQITGQEGTGKTRLLFDCIAYNQKLDPDFMAMYVHTEAAVLPLKPAIEAGIDLNRLLVVNPYKSGEQTFNIALNFIWDLKERKPIKVSANKPLVDLMIIDSVTSAEPEADVTHITEHGLGGVGQPGRLAAMMSRFFRYVCGSGMLWRTALVVVNQQRVSIAEYMTPRKGTGGEACKYYPKITITMRKSFDRKEQLNKQVTGHNVVFEVTKNNTGRAHPYRHGEYTVRYGVGVDSTAPLIQAAMDRNVILDLGLQKFLVPELNKETGVVTMPKVDINSKPVAGITIKATDGKPGKTVLGEYLENNSWLVSLISSSVGDNIEESTINSVPKPAAD